MKKILFYAVTLAACIALVSCEKQGPARFRGYYSFKTGGTVDIKGKVYDIARDTISIDTLVNEYNVGGRTIRDTSYKYHIKADTLSSRDTSFLRQLVAESGQMHILGKDGDEMIVTMNITGGDPVVFSALHRDGNLTLSPTRRMVAVRPDVDENDETVLCDMTVSGSGQRYDNMILFKMDYSGKYSYEDLEGNVSVSRIDCIATENE
ncbi:MAG: hypothetical protein MJY51_01355 [Bacteroidales bacterium]|nr:hypothetical protein [Bacteroidales bacterium]